MTLTEIRRFAELSRDADELMEMDPADILALLNEVERLRAKLAEQTRAELRLAGTAAGVVDQLQEALRRTAPSSGEERKP